MRKSSGVRLVAMFALVACTTVMARAARAEFPEKPITVIYPWSPGDPVDTVLRTLGEQASQRLGQPLVINNVQGAGGAKSMTAGATAEPDGYTLLNNWVAPQIGAKLFNPDLPYDNDSYIPIAGVMAIPFTLTVAADHPADDIQGFISWANEQGNPMNYGVCAPQSVPRLVGEQFMRSAGVAYNPIPFSGGCMGDNVTGLVNGTLDVTVSVVPATARFAGQVKHLGLLTDERHEQAPELATAKEQGVELGWGNVALGWGGLVVPKDTPEDRVAILQDAIGETVQSEAFTTALGDLAPMIKYVPPGEFEELWGQSIELLRPHVEELKANN